MSALLPIPAVGLPPQDVTGLRAGPWVVTLVRNTSSPPGSAGAEQYRLLLTVDGNGVYELTSDVEKLLQWEPVSSASGLAGTHFAKMGLMFLIQQQGVVALITSADAKGTSDVGSVHITGESVTAIRQGLSGAACLGLVAFGAKFPDKPVALKAENALYAIMTSGELIDQDSSPWRFVSTDSAVQAQMVIVANTATIELRVKYYSPATTAGRRQLSALGPLIKEACRHFRSYGADRSLPVLQVEGSLPLRLTMRVTPTFAGVHCVPDVGPARNKKTNRIECLTMRETVRLPEVSPLEVWGFLVSNLGEILSVQTGRLTALVAAKRLV